MTSTYYLARDGYGDLALWESGAEPLLRKCDLPPKTRERVWDLFLEALGVEDALTCEPCGATTEDVENCDHGVTACPDCRNEGACHLCDREAVGAA